MKKVYLFGLIALGFIIFRLVLYISMHLYYQLGLDLELISAVILASIIGIVFWRLYLLYSNIDQSASK